ncbi:MAG: tRNA (adenosine(37)-N6)-dimethylallyltransferase MiaA [Lentisphaeria bacterium]
MKCVVVTGPTATGKTELAARLADKFNGEIIGADSRQIYKGLDIGSGKDLDEFKQYNPPIPYHLIDQIDPREDYNLFRYQQDAVKTVQACHTGSRLPLLVGGSPLYLTSVLDHYTLEGGSPDPEFRESIKDVDNETLLHDLRNKAPDIYHRTDKTQRKRIVRALEIAHQRSVSPKEVSHTPAITLDPLIIAPFYPRPVIHDRIRKRLDKRLAQGMLEEVEYLHNNGLSWERLEFFGLEYRVAALYLQGKLNYQEFYNTLLQKIRRLCKSQEVWFRKMEREGKLIYWLPQGDFEKAVQLISDFLADHPLPSPSFQLQNHHYGPQTNPHVA